MVTEELQGFPAPAAGSQSGVPGQPGPDQAGATQEAPPSDTAAEQESEQVDWQVRALAAEGRAEKLEQTNRSQQGRQRKEDEREALLQSVVNSVDGLKKSHGVLANSLASGDTEGVAGQLQEIEQQANQAQSEGLAERMYRGYWNALEQANLDADKNPVMDLQTAPELAHVRQEWAGASRKADFGALGLLVAETEAIKGQKLLERERQASAVEKKATKDAALKANRDSGVLDQDTGPGAGAGSGEAKWGDTDLRTLSPEQLAERKKALTQRMAKEAAG
tara:strand:- start:1744 stop:2577 length:834 start_codon:yes stop_codon:yes gene_type:complete